jgi:hypothetical protein
MTEDLLDSAEKCLSLLHEGLDGAQLQIGDDTIHAPQAAALLSRMVFLCESALALARTPQRAAGAVLLRPAIECWIDCCYVLYCKAEAVLQLSSLGLREREKLARIWLGTEPLAEIVEQIDALDVVVASGKQSGMLGPDFELRNRMTVEERLRAAILGRGATPSYLDVYHYLYRGISTSEVHTSVAIDFHAELSDDEAVFRISPEGAIDVVVLIVLLTRLACGAAADVFALLGIETDELVSQSSVLDVRLGEVVGDLKAVLEASAAPETVRALEELRRRASLPQ